MICVLRRSHLGAWVLGWQLKFGTRASYRPCYRLSFTCGPRSAELHTSEAASISEAISVVLRLRRSRKLRVGGGQHHARSSPPQLPVRQTRRNVYVTSIFPVSQETHAYLTSLQEGRRCWCHRPGASHIGQERLRNWEETNNGISHTPSEK